MRRRWRRGGRLRITARDASGNIGMDASPVSFTINGTPTMGDMNCDGTLNGADAVGLVLALVDPAGYAAAYPTCDINRADCDLNGTIDGQDVQAFVDLVMAP